MKLEVKLTGDQELRRQLLQIGQAMAKRALAATAVDAERFIEREAAQHNRTGALVRSIYKRRDGAAWEIGHDPRVAPYALFVHWGTRPHVIRAKHKKALRWPAGGAFRFAKGVKHPGAKADPWLVRAARQAPLDFRRHVAAFLAQAQR